MIVQDLILADYAEANPGGKFTLVGAGITDIFAKKVPCMHPLVFVFIRLKVTRADIGVNKIEIKLIGEKGSIFKAEADLNVAKEHSEEQQIPLVIRMVNAKFDSYGEYEFQVYVNGGDPKMTQIIRIKEHPAPAQAIQ